MHSNHNAKTQQNQQSNLTALADGVSRAERSGAGPRLAGPVCVDTAPKYGAGAVKMPEKSPLGTHGKSCSALQKTDEEAAIIRQYELQGAYRELLDTKAAQGCQRWKLKKKHGGNEQVELWQDAKTGKGYYKNLQFCANVWCCPVCGAKISERRRLELFEGIVNHRAGGGGVVMITFTIRHKQEESCADVLGRSSGKSSGLLGAQAAFWQGRAGTKLRSDFGIVGRVRSLEVTHGDNGWHPHTHVLLFTDHKWSQHEADKFQEAAFARWWQVLDRFGRDALADYGVKVDTANQYISDYITKFGRAPADDRWSEAHELAKGVVKKGRADGRTPMQLLADYNDNQDFKAGMLWQEYAAAFKGKRQLVWSDGLRELLGLGEEKSDQEVTEETTSTGNRLAIFTDDAWSAVYANGLRGEVRQAARYGAQGVFILLRDNGIIGVEFPGMYDDFG